MVALLAVGYGDAAKLEPLPDDAGYVVLDGPAATARFLVLTLPVARSGRRREAWVTHILGPHQRASQIPAKDAAVLPAAVVLPESAHDGSVGSRVIANADDSAVGRVLAPFVEEVQAIGERHLGGLFECGERAQVTVHGQTEFFGVHGDRSIG